MKAQTKNYWLIGGLGLLCFLLSSIGQARGGKKSVVDWIGSVFFSLSKRIKALESRANQAEQIAKKTKKELNNANKRLEKLEEWRKKVETSLLTLHNHAFVKLAGQRHVWKIRNVSFEVRWIPGGSFLMGSKDEKKISDKGPQRRVRISRGFWMMETEVTQGQWKALMGSNPSKFKKCGDNCPVEQVNWHDARAFADKLSAAQELTACTATDSGIFRCQGWRLPTETEWEYAARASSIGSRYGKIDDVAWYKKNSGHQTRLVGIKEPNSFGLHDMLGNVWEWTMDTYPNSYIGLAPHNPLRSNGSSRRVVRGASWCNPEHEVRSAVRAHQSPTNRHNHVGFRLLRY